MDNEKTTRLLKTARGQIDGIIRMVEEKRYCIDVADQIMACQAVLGRAEKEVLNAHLHNCVMNAVDNAVSDRAEAEKKLEEIAVLLDKLIR